VLAVDHGHVGDDHVRGPGRGLDAGLDAFDVDHEQLAHVVGVDEPVTRAGGVGGVER
jgi:hypothetical protein